MEIAILDHRVEVVYHTQDYQTHKILPTIMLNHTHLIIENMEIVNDNHSHGIDFVTSETI